MELSYDNLEVGQTFPPTLTRIDREAVRRYVLATGGDYTGSDLAPPTFGHLLATPRTAVPGAVVPPGGVHTKQAYEFHRPLHVGEEVTTTMRVAEKGERKGRRYVVYEFEIRAADGALCLVARMTAIPGR